MNQENDKTLLTLGIISEISEIRFLNVETSCVCGGGGGGGGALLATLTSG